MYIGETIRQGHARITNLLLDVRFDQRPEDIQDRPRESFRFEMRHTRSPQRWRTTIDLCGPVGRTGGSPSHPSMKDSQKERPTNSVDDIQDF